MNRTNIQFQVSPVTRGLLQLHILLKSRSPIYCAIEIYNFFAAITTEKKTKEIGIRKVLGATETQITVLLSRNFALLIGLSFLIASPATYWLLFTWLQNFAYRVNINPLLFVAGGFIALSIALLTISYHTLRSARENPVKALRYE